MMYSSDSHDTELKDSKSVCRTDSNLGHGTVSAQTFVGVPDLLGGTRMARVSIGRVWNVSLSDAQSMVENARRNAGGMEISATFKVDL